MGKSSGPKSTSTLSASQQLLANQLVNFLSPGSIPQNKLGSTTNSLIGRGATPYNGQIVPNLLPQFQQAMGQLGQANLQSGLSGIQQGQQTLGQTGPSLQRLLSGQSAVNVPTSLSSGYIQNAIVNPAMQTFNAEIAPQIREGFGHVGAFSSAEGSALSNAASTQQTSINQLIAQAQQSQRQQALQLNAQGSLQGQQLQGMGVNLASLLGGQQANLGQQQTMLPIQASLGTSSALQPFQQNLGAQSSAAYSEFQRTAPENSPWTQLAMGILGQQQKTFYNPQNQFGQTIGNIGSLGLLGSIFGLGNPLGYGAALAGFGLGH